MIYLLEINGILIVSKLKELIKKNNTLLELGAVILIIALAVFRWLFKFQLWPDSSNYLSAALNLVDQGKLFVFVNWPKQGFDPVIVPYTAYPPGFPLYLSAFLPFFGDPIIAAAVAQSFSLTFFYLLIYQVTKAFQFSPFVRLSSLVFILGFSAFTQIQTGLLNEPLYISICLATFLCALKLWEKPSPKVWIFALCLVFIGGTIRWNGFANAAILIVPLWKDRSQRPIKLILLGLASTLPNITWFIRNKIQFGSTTNLYQFRGILWDNVSVPFDFSVYRWGFGSIWILLFLNLIIFGPILFSYYRKKVNLPFYFIALFQGIIQFLAIYLLTLVVVVTPIDDRYLSPAAVFFVVLLFYSLDLVIKALPLKVRSTALPLLLIFVIVPGAIHTISKQSLSWIGQLTRPPEQELWQTIKTRPYYSAASHFYSDDNFIHQIFAQKIHRIIWGNILTNEPKLIESLWDKGNKPFFVMTHGSALHKYFVNEGGLKSGMKIESINGFWVIYK